MLSKIVKIIRKLSNWELLHWLLIMHVSLFFYLQEPITESLIYETHFGLRKNCVPGMKTLKGINGYEEGRRWCGTWSAAADEVEAVFGVLLIEAGAALIKLLVCLSNTWWELELCPAV